MNGTCTMYTQTRIDVLGLSVCVKRVHMYWFSGTVGTDV